MSIFQTKSCFIIIGASRGIGKSIAINFAKKANIDSLLILMSRDTYTLKKVVDEIESCRPKLKVIMQQLDQGQTNESLFENVFTKHQLIKYSYDLVMIVHNAATVGDNSKYAKEFNDIEEMNSYFTTNLTGTIFWNNAFMSFFSQDKFQQRIIVNISSSAAVHPFINLALYCAGKAAREMFFKVLATEDASVKVLNYSPGVCATDMLNQIRENASDPRVKQILKSMYEEGKVLDCDTTVKKLIQILEDNTFVSGSSIDYCDV